MDNAICLNSNTYHGYSLEEAVFGAQAAGIRFMEIAAVRGHTEHARSDMNDDEIAALLGLLAENEITLLGMCGHSNIVTEEGRAQFRENLALASKLGVSYVVTGTGETHDDDHVIEDDTELVEIFRGLAADAAEHGLTVAIETHGNNYGTGASIKSLIGKVGAENLRINYDTGNVIFYGDARPEEDLVDCASSVVALHLKDKAGLPKEWNFPAIGDGNIDFERIFRTLIAAGCMAPLSIEIEFTPDGPGSVEAVHDALARSAQKTRALQASVSA
ncbi:sugar phosphate isomerase/epimerase family protein [Microbacterium sp.]|uniref:sugar phosphate isomerase/epimerase family protein n=1 Tax=Microbacterium sp. TaxID=51671 RepID=UPI003F9BB2AE